MTVGRLRERRKVETRQLIIEAALDLFEQQGYEQTTVDDIAAATGISARTFFRYFESKLAVLTDKHGPEHEADHRALVDAIVARPSSESPLQALRAVLGDDLVAHFAEEGNVDLRRLRLVLADAQLRMVVRDQFDEHRSELTQAFATRLGVPEDALAPRVLSAACIEAIWIVFDRWAAAGAELDQLPEMLNDALDTLISLG